MQSSLHCRRNKYRVKEIVANDITQEKHVRNKIPPEHVGVILLQEFLEPNVLHSDDVAKAAGISEYELKEIIEGKIDMSETIAQKLSEFFGLSDNYFENIQKQKAKNWSMHPSPKLDT